MFWTWA